MTKSVREGSFRDYNKRTFIEFKYKANEARGKNFAKIVSAFANTNGGHIIVGVFEKDGLIKDIQGIPSKEVENILKSFGLISPCYEPTHGEIYQELFINNNKSILIFFIPMETRLYGVREGSEEDLKIIYYKRVGPESIPITDNEIPKFKEEKNRFKELNRIIE
ncbi:MAG: helix-turn-helix domain-containing protein [Promethearchaeota archaeon]